MTPFQTTPSIWIAFQNQEEANSLVSRMESFAHGKKLQSTSEEIEGFLLDNQKTALVWLLVDAASCNDDRLISAAHGAKDQNEFFRCAVIGSNLPESWPNGTLHMDSNSLSTSILDRLRNESHALRIANSRLRHMRRLQNR